MYGILIVTEQVSTLLLDNCPLSNCPVLKQDNPCPLGFSFPQDPTRQWEHLQ